MIKQIPVEEEIEIPKLETSDGDTLTRINESIEELWEKDCWLLTEELNERCIAHKLAIYLASRFPDYQVDCEYNGDIENVERDKIVGMLRADIIAIGRELNVKELLHDNPWLMRHVNPDIIIHSRKTNKNNLCVLELKTRYNPPAEVRFDDLKLKAYTRPKNNYGMGYQLGIYLDFRRRADGVHINLTEYRNGEIDSPEESLG
jgi:hypothetical protein